MTGPKGDTSADVAALEEMMDEVVESLAVAEQAAAYIEANCPGSAAQNRAGVVRRQAEAMLDAADEAAEAEEDGDDDGSTDTEHAARPSGMLH